MMVRSARRSRASSKRWCLLKGSIFCGNSRRITRDLAAAVGETRAGFKRADGHLEDSRKGGLEALYTADVVVLVAPFVVVAEAAVAVAPVAVAVAAAVVELEFS